LIILLLSSFLTAEHKNTQKPQWKGKIEYENGIKVIKNPREPLYGEITLELEEDLSIGNEEDKNYYFYRGLLFDVDREGNIFIFDPPNYRIQQFNKRGEYIRSIGRKGQGPGEFENPSYVYLDKGGNIYVPEGFSNKIQIFDKKGEFKNCIRLETSIKSFGITERENIILLSDNFRPDKLVSEIFMINSSGRLKRLQVTHTPIEINLLKEWVS
jgi:hypothetical protein